MAFALGYYILDITPPFDTLKLFVETDCATARLYSDLITNFAGVGTLEVVVKDIVASRATGTDVETTTSVDVGDIVDEGGGLKHYPLTTGGDDGIYQVQVITRDAGGDQTDIQTACMFLDCTLRCKLLTASLQGMMLHYTLWRLQACSCDCEKLATVYEALLGELNMKLPDSTCIPTNFSDCFGC